MRARSSALTCTVQAGEGLQQPRVGSGILSCNKPTGDRLLPIQVHSKEALIRLWFGGSVNAGCGVQLWIHCVVLEALVSQPLESAVFHDGDRLTVATSTWNQCLLWSIAQFFKLQEVTQLIHPWEGGETSSLEMTDTFPGRLTISPEASGSDLSTLGWPEGLRGPGEVKTAPLNASRL